MTPLSALFYSFLFGLLHGVLPDEHTWPITFSYAVAGGSGKEGMKAGLYFSAAFTIQRAIVSELAWLALAPVLLDPVVNGIVYVVVGVAMSAAGLVVLREGRYLHIHLLGRCYGEGCERERGHPAGKYRLPSAPLTTPRRWWTLIHGFIAGFGFGGFSLFVNTVAAPAMRSAWTGFLPGLIFGLGSMVMLVIVGGFFGLALRRIRVSDEQVRRIGAGTGGRTLFYGGVLFISAGIAVLSGLDRVAGIDTGYVLMALFIMIVAVPAFIFSWREVAGNRKPGQQTAGPTEQIGNDYKQR